MRHPAAIASLILLLAVRIALAQDAPPDADLVLLDGRIVTVDDDLGTVEALAVIGDRIVEAGTTEAIRARVGAETQIIDLEGRLAIPGFIEGHGHFVGLGQAKMNLDLMTVRNWDEVIELVEEAVDASEPGAWIVGRGWHQEKWDRPPEDAVAGFPTHDRLSAISPDNPVVLTHASGHASFANKKAMDESGVSASTPDPDGGEILRDENGRPIGIFNETAQRLVRQPRARRGVRGNASSEIDLAIDLAVRECLSKGVTSFQDAGSSLAVVEALAARARAGTLGVRLWVMIREPDAVLQAHLGDYATLRRLGNGFFTVGGIKWSIDGALGSRGAWLLEPYADSPESTGLATASIEDVTASAHLAAQHGLQLCVHAIGDRANREVLDIYEEALTAQPDEVDLRWRIEHAQHLDPADIPRFGQLGVIASMQGVHCTSDGPWVYARLGPERAEAGAYVWQKLMQSGAIVTNGTDAPVEDVDPIASFDASVTRRLKDGSIFFGDQRMSRMEALRSYTIDCAYAAFEEDLKGSLTPGKLADIVVLSRDILEVPEAEIGQAKVLYTIVGGKIVYERRADG